MLEFEIVSEFGWLFESMYVVSGRPVIGLMAVSGSPSCRSVSGSLAALKLPVPEVS